MDVALKLVLGAVVGGAGGFLLARLRGCAATACNVKARTIASVIGGAVFGAAVAWWAIGG
jgi:hypothetical protein